MHAYNKGFVSFALCLQQSYVGFVSFVVLTLTVSSQFMIAAI